jgi:hypothetical protein
VMKYLRGTANLGITYHHEKELPWFWAWSKK